jgi:hypothetical protein
MIQNKTWGFFPSLGGLSRDESLYKGIIPFIPLFYDKLQYTPNEILAFCSESIQWLILPETVSKGHRFQTHLMHLQQRSMILYYVLHKKSNMTIQAKVSFVYGKDALCQHRVETSPPRFRSGRTSVEDDDRSGRLSTDSLSDAVSFYLNRNPQALCQEIAKDLFIPATTILRVLDQMGLRFFIAR